MIHRMPAGSVSVGVINRILKCYLCRSWSFRKKCKESHAEVRPAFTHHAICEEWRILFFFFSLKIRLLSFVITDCFLGKRNGKKDNENGKRTIFTDLKSYLRCWALRTRHTFRLPNKRRRIFSSPKVARVYTHLFC